MNFILYDYFGGLDSIYQYFKYLCAPKKGAVLYSLVQTGFRPYKKKKISSE